MKKPILVLLIALLAAPLSVMAQQISPVIQELRDLLMSARTNFKADIGAKDNVDSAGNVAIFRTRKETASAETFIMQPLHAETRTYVIRYNVQEMAPMMIPLMTNIVKQYIGEIRGMVASGNYTSRDYTDDAGMAVTEVKSKGGTHILDYASNAETQSIFVFGTGR